MPERGETPRLKTVLKMLGSPPGGGGLRGRVMLVKAGRETLGAVGTMIDGMSVVGIETAGALGRSVRRLGVEIPRMAIRVGRGEVGPISEGVLRARPEGELYLRD